MKEDFYISLIYKQLNGETTNEENRQLEEWLLQDENHQTIANEIQLVFGMSDSYMDDEVAQIDVDAAFEKQMSMITEASPSPLKIVSNNTKKEPARTISSNRNKWMSAAAAVVILVVAGLWWNNSSQTDFELVAANDGKVVELKDGSKVTLTKGSILKYSKSFNKADRNVELKGQAFFDVEKSTTPFIVKTTEAEVKVLGTQFDLKENIQTNMVYLIVKEGKVNIKLNTGENKDVSAGEQITADVLAKNFTMPRPTSRNAVRIFEFNETPIQEVIEQLQNNYNVEIAIDERIFNCVYTGSFKNKKLDKILKQMDKVLGSTTILQKDGAYLIEGEGCE